MKIRNMRAPDQKRPLLSRCPEKLETGREVCSGVTARSIGGLDGAGFLAVAGNEGVTPSACCLADKQRVRSLRSVVP